MRPRFIVKVKCRYIVCLRYGVCNRRSITPYSFHGEARHLKYAHIPPPNIETIELRRWGSLHIVPETTWEVQRLEWALNSTQGSIGKHLVV